MQPFQICRLYIHTSLSSGQKLTIAGPQTHYLVNVMRLKAGDQIRLFNGQDGEWLAQIEAVNKKAVEIALTQQLRAQQIESDIWLCCAPIKKAHFDYMIEKATELGVARIQPILTSRTQIREVNTERCRSMAIEAAEQSERLNIPVIDSPLTLQKLVAAWPADRHCIVCAEHGEAVSVADALQKTAQKNSEAAIITGPEGGFSEDELKLLRSIPNSTFVRLGPRILRADTAAISALSIWQSLCGDWQITP